MFLSQDGKGGRSTGKGNRMGEGWKGESNTTFQFIFIAKLLIRGTIFLAVLFDIFWFIQHLI